MGPRVNSGNVVGIIKEESFNCQAINLELPQSLRVKTPTLRMKSIPKKIETGVEKQVPDKTCEHLGLAMPELS